MRSLLLAAVLTATPALAQQNTARYRVTFHATWSSQTHPNAYPGGAHFSPMIGGTHNGNLDLWEPGDLSTGEMEIMAETGSPGPLASIVNDAINAGDAGTVIQGGSFNSPGSDAETFLITEDHPLVSLVSMIAPSPDWFIGVDSVSLLENGNWVDKTFVLYAWDAGTDSGPNFNSGNSNTNPADPITLITGGPFFGNDPLGTFVFERIPLGQDYCSPAVANSTGQPANLFVTGSGAAGDPLTLTADQMPLMQFGYFLVSADQGLVQPPGSSGNLCLSGNIGRFTGPGQTKNSGADGSFFLVVDSSTIPQNPPVAAMPGDTFHFQGWFRDGAGDSNFTDGVSVTFN